MKRSLFTTIISPLGKRYNNTVKTKQRELILNTNVSVDDYSFTNRIGVVKQLPLYNVPYKVGDKIIVHTNVFRKFYDVYGNLKNGGSYLNEDSYSCNNDQIYAYHNGEKWVSINGRVFISPIERRSNVFIDHLERFERCIGTLAIGNEVLEKEGILEGDTVGFLYGSEFKFIIDDKIMYNMPDYKVCAKYD